MFPSLMRFIVCLRESYVSGRRLKCKTSKNAAFWSIASYPYRAEICKIPSLALSNQIKTMTPLQLIAVCLSRFKTRLLKYHWQFQCASVVPCMSCEAWQHDFGDALVTQRVSLLLCCMPPTLGVSLTAHACFSAHSWIPKLSTRALMSLRGNQSFSGSLLILVYFCLYLSSYPKITHSIMSISTMRTAF